MFTSVDMISHELDTSQDKDKRYSESVDSMLIT